MSQHKPEGAGVGLRSQHYSYILNNKPDIPWFEALTENYMGEGGMPLHHLEKIRQNYPLTFHGVGMSLGSTDPLNMDYLKILKNMMTIYQPLHVSDHLSWVSFQNHYAHELLPFPYNNETLKHLEERISFVQEYLGQHILIENPSSYMNFNNSDITEWDFINELTRTTGCKLLLDINNVYVSSFNIGLDAEKYIQLIEKDSIEEIHLAGFEDRGSHLYDTHGDKVDQNVWQLYQKLIEINGPVASLIEWDTDIPDFSILHAEAKKAQLILDKNSLTSSHTVSACI